jgi:hypothetical protein
VVGKEIAVKKYVVRLSAEEHAQLDELIRKGKRSAQLLTKARILLKADVSELGEGWSDSRIAAALDTSIATIERTRRQLVEAQIQSQFRPAADFRRRSRSKIDRADPLSGPGGFRSLEPAPARGEGRRTAHCRARQRQHDRADAKKNILKPHRKQQWVIPPDANAAFVATMEDVLEVYQRPHDPQRPLVCLDETSKQLIIETRAPISAKPGQPARHDYEYERNGVANLFMVFAPLEGWRHVKVTDRHTAIDYAHVLRDLSDTHFPDAAKIVLLQDNLNTHKPASLYEAFPAPEARRLVERFEWHYTPKHGSWLDLAESELGVLASQCLDRRIADKQILAREVAAWQDHRNKRHAKADWQFTTANARVKLKRLYPQFE